MKREDAGIKLIQMFASLNLARRTEQMAVIKDALGYDKPIREMDKQEIEKVIKSIMGE